MEGIISTIEAAQLIYTRVEPAYSPQNRAGFQTVYKSKSLSEQDVSDIEKRVQCFQPCPPAPIRLQFFVLNSGKIVLTNTVQIESHPEIIDKYFRKGAFISYCLILDRSDFDKIKRNPFVIFDHCQFVTDAENMVAAFGQATGRAPIKSIEAPEKQPVPECSWKGNDMRKLIFLAMQAEQLIKERKSLFLIGQEGSIEETLRDIFYLLPEYQRLLCSFDTCVDGCSVQSGSYWAVGGIKRQEGSAYIHVDTNEHRIISQVQERSEEQELYWGWLNVVTSQEDFDSAIKRTPTMQMLSTAFTERREININELDEAVGKEFLHLYEKRVKEDLQTTLAKIIGKKLAELCLEDIYHTLEMPILLNIAACQSIDQSYLSVLVADYIVARKPNLDDKDWKILQDIAQQNDHPVLLYLSVTLRKKTDEKLRDKALLNMDQEEFLRISEFLMNPLDPLHFVTPRYLEILVEDNRLEGMTEEQLFGLVKAILDVNAPKHLDALAQYVGEIENKTLVQLEKLLKKHAERVPGKFDAAVLLRREELGKSSRIWGLFRT